MRNGYRWLGGVLFVLACAGLVGAIAWLHAGQTRAFPSGAEAAAHDAALMTALKLLRGDVVGALQQLWWSTPRPRSDWFALAAAPFPMVFGESRQVYVTGLALVTVLPFALAAGLLCSRIAGPRLFRPGVLLALLTPAVWSPALRGLPEMGAAALFLFALVPHCRERAPGAGKAALSGFALGLALMLRPELALPAAALALVLLLAEHWRGAVTVVVAAAVATGGAWPLVARLPAGDLSAFGEGGLAEAATALDTLALYGAVPLLLAAVGLVWSLRARRGPVLGLAVFLLVLGALALWRPDPWAGTAAPLTGLVVVGLAALWRRLRRSRPALAALVLVMALNAANAWVPLAPPWVAAAPQPPERRSDVAEVHRLLDVLEAEAGQAPVQVLASSPLLSGDMLWHADRARHPFVRLRLADGFWNNLNLNLPHWPAMTDGSEPYPLERLLRAQVVVTAAPIQHRPGWAPQKVLAAAHAVFAEDWDLADDFAPLPERFALEGGVEARVYRRLRPTAPETAVRTLARMQALIPRPGGQGDWMSLGSDRAWLTAREDGGVQAVVEWRGAPVALAFVAPAAGPLRVAARVSGHECLPGVTVEAALHDSSGTRVETAAAAVSGADLALPLAAPLAGHVVLHVTTTRQTPLPAPCWLYVRGLRLETAPLTAAAQG